VAVPLGNLLGPDAYSMLASEEIMTEQRDQEIQAAEIVAGQTLAARTLSEPPADCIRGAIVAIQTHQKPGPYYDADAALIVRLEGIARMLESMPEERTTPYVIDRQLAHDLLALPYRVTTYEITKVLNDPVRLSSPRIEGAVPLVEGIKKMRDILDRFRAPIWDATQPPFVARFAPGISTEQDAL
jgi:hypothetical protein